MAPWQEMVLIILCCASLIISLWCIFNMVPVKRFSQLIRSLGGGVKGIEAHMDNVRDEIERTLAELENSTQQQVAQVREATEAAVEKVGRESREARRELDRVRNDLQALQAELRGAAGDSRKVSRGVGELTKQLQQLRSDFDVLDVELRESVRQQVANSFTSVESTVLSALEAIQEEIVHGTGAPHGRSTPLRPDKRHPSPAAPFTRDATRRTPENIITVKPLFGELRQDEQAADDGEDKDEAPEPQESGTETGGADGQEDKG